MKPFLCAALFAALTVTGPAFAASKKDRNCDRFGEMTDEIVTLRKAGMTETDALLEMGKRHEGEKPATLQVLPVLASFVFGLKVGELDQEPGAAMAAQCKAG